MHDLGRRIEIPDPVGLEFRQHPVVIGDSRRVGERERHITCGCKSVVQENLQPGFRSLNEPARADYPGGDENSTANEISSSEPHYTKESHSFRSVLDCSSDEEINMQAALSKQCLCRA